MNNSIKFCFSKFTTGM
ncbi:hypothetical protein AAH212_004331 [Salmonella enterica]|nr:MULTISPECIES: peptide IlvX [Salmonella]EKR1690483.1 hypothetical protein [Salmonella enterica subsp. diarizonae serovar 6,7,14:k:z50]EKR1872359.1 hypothetical protein [Salmonella enterica subsp. diarizonae serovar 11:k:z53]MBJ3319335.1 hypothetical protein [Salmonella enterica subsp. enterica serovar Typhimurium]MBJ3755599.1 hypothetical protein [Salmonella enterica subsp. enterica serovar Derby]HCK6840978.1 hypothetical protein [Salmonella enterica subsp. enterica serovar Typhi str. CT18]